MNRQWDDILYLVKRRNMEACLILDPSSTIDEISEAENKVGKLPSAVQAVLENWKEQGGAFLLTGLPAMLNPHATEGELNPTGRSIYDLFPEFCKLLKDTRHLAIIIDPTVAIEQRNLRFMLVGLREGWSKNNIAKTTSYWTCYLPHTLESLLAIEAASEIPLSPQFRQIYLRANGSPSLLCPYFSPAEWLIEGAIADVYQDIWSEIDSIVSFDQLKKFVTFSEDGTGNEVGFFIDEKPENEYPIYFWDHETIRFSRHASDFAGWLERILIRGSY